MGTTEWAVSDAVLRAAGETWGISGPDFLSVYLPLAIAAVLVSVWLRMRAVTPPDEHFGDVLTPPELGVLKSDHRAIMASVALLRAHDLIDRHGQASDTGAARKAGLDRFTQSVCERLDEPDQSIVAVTSRMRIPLEELRAPLVEHGYLASADMHARQRRAAVPILVVGVLGLLRLIAGLANGRPIAWLLLILVALAVCWWWVRHPARITRRGKAALKSASTDRKYLRPNNSPAYATYGPAAAAFAVALFGTQAMTLLDPELNRAMAVPTADGSGGGGGGWGSGDSGGDSGGGGGDGGGGCGGGGCGG